MFIREKATRTTPVLQLVRNRRGADGKVKQEIVVSLGQVPIPDEHRLTIAHEVDNRLQGYQRLLPLEHDIGKWVDFILNKIEAEGKLPPVTCKEVKSDNQEQIDGVIVDKLSHTQGAELGPVLAVEAAWRALGLDKFLKDADFSTRQINSAKIAIFNRLIDPCSENELKRWAETTALNELLGENISLSGEDRFYRVSDKLLAIQADLEKYLREKEADLFSLDRIYLLYDLTNSYFEGEAGRNPQARRSANSKEKRTDRPLLSVGLVLDRDGFVITHKVFAGNLHDSRTLARSVKDLRDTCAHSDRRPIVIVDGGIATRANLEYLRKNGFDYVVNGNRTSRRQFAEDFFDRSAFEKISGRDDPGKTPVYVRKLKRNQENIILCRSDSRKRKEDAIVSKMEERFLRKLNRLRERIIKNDGKLHLGEGGDTVNRTIGRICSKYTRAAKYYTITYEAELRQLTWERKDQLYREDEQLHGCYFLRTTRFDFSEDEIWKIYITLTKVEDAFRLLKSDLGLRPFRHHLESRCEGHIWITILAYHLLRWIEYTLQCHNYNATWRAVRRMLQTHCYATLTVPTADGIVRRIRKPGRPDEKQRLVYDLLGMDPATLPVHRTMHRVVKKT